MNEKKYLTLKKIIIGITLALSLSLVIFSYYYLFYAAYNTAGEKYGLTFEEVVQLWGEKPVYFIDAREPEFFKNNYYRIREAVNIRVTDIERVADIQEALQLDEQEAAEALFILICFEGATTKFKAIDLSSPNIKFLKGGIESLISRFYEGSKPFILSISCHYSDFSKNEFIDKEVINRFIDIIRSKGIQLEGRGIEALNTLLKNTNLYDIWQEKNFYADSETENLISTLAYKSNHLRNKAFIELAPDERKKIKNLNRVLLDNIYLQEVPLKHFYIYQSFLYGIREHEFSINVEKAIQLLNSDKTKFIDTRSEPEFTFSFAGSFLLDSWPADRYKIEFQNLINFRDSNIILIAEDRGDFFIRSMLLIQRMVRELDFEVEQFSILFGKSRELKIAANSNPN